MTFRELYLKEKEKPTAAQKFVRKVMELTGSSEVTVSKWLSGEQLPQFNKMHILSEHFGQSIEKLFPPVEKKEKTNDTD